MKEQNSALSQWRAHNKNRPNSPAVIFEERTLKWQDLWLRSNRLANAYLQLGLTKGDRVQILLPNCLEFPEIIMAGNKAGLINTSGNYRLTGSELLYQLNDCKARALVIYSAEQYERISAIRNELPELEHVIVISDTPATEAISYESLLNDASSEDPRMDVLPEDIGLFMYTSGTTGFPKGVMRSVGSIDAGSESMSIELGLTSDDIFLAAAPMYAAATVGCVSSALFSGGTVVVMPHFDPSLVLQYIERYKISWIFMVPIMYEWVLDQPPEVLGEVDISSLRHVIACGAPLHNKTAERMVKFFKEAAVSNWLGASELGYMAYYDYKKGLKAEGCVGKPIYGIELEIFDEKGSPLEKGHPGVLYARGKTLFDGYFNREESTREAFLEGGWGTVGDVAIQDAEGDFFIVDRKNDMIISGGINVYPVEIEQVIQKIEGVEDNAVIGVPDEKWGESVKALVVKKPGSTLTSEDIVSACKKYLAGFKVPKSVEFIDIIPRSPIGKTLKKELRKKYWEGKEHVI